MIALPRTHDPEIRAALRLFLEDAHCSDPTAVVIDEFGVFHGRHRADLVAVNGALDGYEIKSDADTLDRLADQVAMFSRVFDTMTLVCAPRHLRAAKRRIPRWWGLTTATSDQSGIRLEVKRPARANPTIEPELIARLLWRDEAIALLRAEALIEDARSMRRWDLLPLLAEVPLDRLRASVRESIKCRTNWRGVTLTS